MAQVRTIGRIAKEAGVSVETIRFYERRGLIAQPSNAGGGYRHYDDQTLAMVRYIKVAQQLGLSLRDVEGITRSLSDPSTFCSAVRQSASNKLSEIVSQMGALVQMKKDLEGFLTRCASRNPELPCPILEELTKLSAAVERRPAER